MHCPASRVFEVLANGWLYPSWVVGASRMRDVDALWPQPGSDLHHSFGVWPALINDETRAESWNPPHSMQLIARGWPVGEARVRIDVKSRGRDCVVRIQEEAVSGPGRFVPRPIMDALLRWRNSETLHRLAYLAEGMRPSAGADTADREGVHGVQGDHGNDQVLAEQSPT